MTYRMLGAALFGAWCTLSACDAASRPKADAATAEPSEETALADDDAALPSLDAAPPPVEAGAPRADAAPATAPPATPASDAESLALDGGSDAASPSLITTADAGSDAESGESAAHVVGTMRVEIVARGERKLPLQLWYPAPESARAEASAGHPVSELEPEGPRRALLARLLASAPEPCTNRRMHAALAAPVKSLATPYPLLVFSHHFEGMRIAMFSLAERLASLGFIVAAPDHTDFSLYDRTDDLQTPDPLGVLLRSQPEQLAIRAGDIESVIDLMLDAKSAAIPDGIRGQIDPARIGVFGHSMGSMTSGIVAARNPRVKAAAYLSFPPAQLSALLNVLDQPAIESFHAPALFMLNQEDASLNAIGGNDALRAQFEAHAPLSYLVEVRNTGHWSFADDCALIPDFADGCGSGMRSAKEPYEAYQNLDNGKVREIAAHYLAVFFASQFLGQSPAALAQARSSDEVVRTHAAAAAAGDAGSPRP